MEKNKILLIDMYGVIIKELGIQTILFNRDGEEYDGRVVNDFEELAEMLQCV